MTPSMSHSTTQRPLLFFDGLCTCLPREMLMTGGWCDGRWEIYFKNGVISVISWCLVMFYDILWCFMMFYDVLWCLVDLSWLMRGFLQGSVTCLPSTGRGFWNVFPWASSQSLVMQHDHSGVGKPLPLATELNINHRQRIQRPTPFKRSRFDIWVCPTIPSSRSCWIGNMGYFKSWTCWFLIVGFQENRCNTRL